MAGHIIYVHTTIDAPPEAVWDVVTDVERMAQFLRSVRRCEPLTEGAVEVGTRWREERTLFGHRGEEDRHVVECDAPNRLVIETVVAHDVVHSSYRITPFGATGDRTRLAMTTNLDTSHRSGLGRLEWMLFGGHSHERTRRILQHDLEDIEAEVVRRAQRGADAA